MSNTTPDIQAIFCEALGKKSDLERSEFLDAACGDNVELRSKVQDLLMSHREAGNFLGRPDDPEPTEYLAFTAEKSARKSDRTSCFK